MNKKSQMFTAWMDTLVITLILILVPFLIYFVLSNNYITVVENQLNSNNYVCTDNIPSLKQLTTNSSFDLRFTPDDSCYQFCSSQDTIKEIYKTKDIVKCVKDIPICNCQATYWSYYIKPILG